MVADKLKMQLLEYNIPQQDIDALDRFLPRDGFQFLSEEEFDGMMVFISQYEDDFGHIIPLLTDDNSNFICINGGPENHGYICYLSHDEINLNPLFKSARHLIDAVNSHQEAWDITELPPSVFDFTDLPF
ncbi:SMI1/KNR4 family protein [Chitinophaga arvensicola]|uniref:SMI1 / KNR4 family (SUKH-1) n=1 Tax=Chitinophaga arvensicola TaxID=29529 RepID=A0A1I0S9N8_9BACT|nr:SMI1/KNR4 family protein [Chitinophaga arvensicola]SEW52894.1 hypothetical protein SAMN04488122_5216 [Chitinophaga arvensicola]